MQRVMTAVPPPHELVAVDDSAPVVLDGVLVDDRAGAAPSPVLDLRSFVARSTVSDPERVAELAFALAQAEAFYDAALAESTRASYETGWRHFTAWCARFGFTPLPAEPEVIALYLGAYVEPSDWKPSTVDGRIAAIAHVHAEHGLPSPTANLPMRRIQRGIRRKLKHRPRGKAAARLQLAITLLEALELPNDKGRLRHPLALLRDRALVLTTYAAALRRAEVVALNLPDIRVTAVGLELDIRSSKGDQEGRGFTAVLERTPHRPDLCPVTAMLAWFDAIGMRHLVGAPYLPDAHVPAFYPVTAHGTVRSSRLTAQHLWRIVKSAAEAAGLEPEAVADLGAHSLRKGLPSDAEDAGLSWFEITRLLRHRKRATSQVYVEGGGGAHPTPFGAVVAEADATA